MLTSKRKAQKDGRRGKGGDGETSVRNAYAYVRVLGLTFSSSIIVPKKAIVSSYLKHRGGDDMAC